MTVDKCESGIEGLDQITQGGLPARRATLVRGEPGVGKTILSMQWLSHGAENGENGVMVTFDQSPRRILADLHDLAFDLPGAVESGAITMLDFRPAVVDTVSVGAFELDPFMIRVRHAIESNGAKRLVIESVDALFAALSDQLKLRWELRRMLDELEGLGVTTLLVAEAHSDTFPGVEYLADCVLQLTHDLQGRIATRYVRVSKYRGSSHLTDSQPFLISDAGLTVLATRADLDAEVSEERVSTGLQQLDDLLGGGYYRGSSILVSGSAGTGKSSLAAYLVWASAQAGEPALYVSFEESENQLLRNMRSIGLDLGPALKDGTVRFMTARSSEVGLERHLLRVLSAAREVGAHTVVLDPVTNFDAIGSRAEVRSMLARMVDALKGSQTTLLMTALTAQDEGIGHDVALSSIVDTWLTVRNFEADGERNRVMYIMKSRGMSHSNQIREFVVTDEGIQLIDAYIGPGKVLTGSARVAQVRADLAQQRMLEGERARIEEELAASEQAREARVTAAANEYEVRLSELRRMLAKIELELEERHLARSAAAAQRGQREETAKEARP